MMKTLRHVGFGLLFLASLAACSGALDGGGAGVGGAPGAGPGANFAEGTLGSQSDIQQMADECRSPYTLKFNGETSDPLWYLMQPEQKNFPSPGIVMKSSKEPVVNEEICADCEGKTVRVIDMGDPGFRPFQEKMDFSMFLVGVQKHFVKPEIITQARYQDFTVGPVGEVAFKDLPIALGHVYLILLANQPATPVTQPTAFGSPDEFYAMLECSNKPETHPFFRLRVFQARVTEPGHFPGKIPDPNDGTVQIQNLPSQNLEVVTPPSPPDDPVEGNFRVAPSNTQVLQVNP